MNTKKVKFFSSLFIFFFTFLSTFMKIFYQKFLTFFEGRGHSRGSQESVEKKISPDFGIFASGIGMRLR